MAPAFAGLVAAVACLPGPVGGDRMVQYHLRWHAAQGSGVAYRIYSATMPGGESFTRPRWTTRRGATSFTTPPLPSGATYYFVVRAGSRDRNRVERRAVNLCL